MQRNPIVSRLEENSPAARAGIRTGDVVLSVNGRQVDSARDLSRMVAALSAGSTVNLQVWRDGQRQQIAVTIGQMQGTATAAVEQGGGDVGQLGLTLAPAATVAGIDRKGVAVVEVEPGSTAAEKGFRTGDVIAEVAGQPVETPADVRRVLEASRQEGKRSVLFRVESREGARFIAVQTPAA